MIWVYAAVLLGILGLITEMVVAYRSQSEELQEEQDEVRERIRGHEQAITQLRERIAASTRHVEELSAERALLEKDVKVQTQLYKEAEEVERKRNPTRFLFNQDEDW